MDDKRRDDSAPERVLRDGVCANEPASTIPSPCGSDSQFVDGKDTRQQRDAELMEQLCAQHVVRNSFFLWIIGFINNFHYCLVLSAASVLADGYGFKRLVALISWCNVFFGIIVRIITVFVATHTSYNVRITITSIVGLAGVLLVSFAGPIGHGNNAGSFFVVLLGVVLVGIESTYGESAILSFVQRYPADTVGAWSSGTGISGVIATLMYLGLIAAGLTKEQVFLVSIPFLVIYWLAFMFGLVAPYKVATVTRAGGGVVNYTLPWNHEKEYMAKLRSKAEADGDVLSDDYTIKVLTNIRALSWHDMPHAVRQDETDAYSGEHTLDAQGTQQQRQQRAQDDDNDPDDDLYYPLCRVLCGRCSRQHTCRRWWRLNAKSLMFMHNTMVWFFFNLAAVYVAEYAAQFMAPFSFYCSPTWKENFWMTNSYAISQLCYQIGVLISRSSLLCFKIKAVGVITVVQVINAVLWLVQAKTLFISSKSNYNKQLGLSFLLFVWFIFVGLMGGASYVNVFYLILHRSDKLEQQQIDDAVQAYLRQEHEQHREGGSAAATPAEAKRQELHDVNGNTPHDAAASHKTTVNNSSTLDDAIQKADALSHSSDDQQTQLLPRNEAEAREVDRIRTRMHAIWQERRELGMNIGALYASIGITLGSVVDLIFTNVLQLGESSC